MIFDGLKLSDWYVFQSNNCVFFNNLDDFLAQIIQQHHGNLTSVIIPFKRYEDLSDIENQLKRGTIFNNTHIVTESLEIIFPHFKDIDIALKVTFPSNQLALFLEKAETHIFEVTF